MARQEKTTTSKDAAGRVQQYLTFLLKGDLYGIDILNIKEIIEHSGITPVPRMPTCVSGIINLRGAVVPVVDLGMRFTGRRSDITAKTCIVIAEIVEEGISSELGIVVDAVNEVIDIADTDTEPPPAFGGRIRQDFVAAIGKTANGFVVILNVHKVLDVDELSGVRDGVASHEQIEEAA